MAEESAGALAGNKVRRAFDFDDLAFPRSTGIFATGVTTTFTAVSSSCFCEGVPLLDASMGEMLMASAVAFESFPFTTDRRWAAGFDIFSLSLMNDGYYGLERKLCLGGASNTTQLQKVDDDGRFFDLAALP